MAWNQEELDFFSNALGQTITPEMAYGTIGSNNPLNNVSYNEGTGGYNGLDPSLSDYVSYQYGSPQFIDPKTGLPVQRLTDIYQQGSTDILDPSQLQYDPTLGLYTTPGNMKEYEGDWLEKWGWAIPLGIFGAAAMTGAGGAAAGGAVEGAGAGAAIHPAVGMSAAQELAAAGMTQAEIATVLGIPEVSTAIAGGSSVSSLMGNPAIKAAISAVAPKVVSSLTGGGGGFDMGGMLGGAGNALVQNRLSNQQIENAKQLAEGIKFTPYSVSSGMGRTYVDPATGEMKSELAPEWQQAQGTLLDSFYGNMQQATMDPMQASQYAYNMGSKLNAYQDEQNRLGLENRLLSQGMLGATGGASQMRALYDSMNQRDLGREAQSLGLGQDMLSKYQQRALDAYQPAWNTQTQFANQIGQSGNLGGQALQSQIAGANLMNNAFLNRNDMLSQGSQNLFGSPMFSGGSGSLINSGLNAIGNYFNQGNTNTPYEYQYPDMSVGFDYTQGSFPDQYNLGNVSTEYFNPNMFGM